MSKIGRNDICPLCNSGKKYKKCCMPVPESTRAEYIKRLEEHKKEQTPEEAERAKELVSKMAMFANIYNIPGN